MRNIIDRLVNVYLSSEENWHEKKLPRGEAIKYFQRLLEKQRILYYYKDERLFGYVESWRLDYNQWGRIICKEPFSAYEEDVENGEVCYVANTWIDKKYRRSEIYKKLTKAFFLQNQDAKYFVGEARRKKTGLIKVLSKQDILRRYGG